MEEQDERSEMIYEISAEYIRKNETYALSLRHQKAKTGAEKTKKFQVFDKSIKFIYDFPASSVILGTTE